MELNNMCDPTLFELTKEQQKAFNKLEKAFKDCLSFNLQLVNHYGNILAFDAKKISHYDAIEVENSICDTENLAQSFSALDLVSWTDDTTYFHPVITKESENEF